VYVTDTGTLAEPVVLVQVAANVPAVKSARPVTEIKAALVDCVPVNPTVMEVEVDLTVLDNDMDCVPTTCCQSNVIITTIIPVFI
jgi:hypothetical protein